VAELVDLPAGRQARNDSKSCLETTNMVYYVYAIKSLKRNYIYVGLTQDFRVRVNQHNNGRSKTTRSYRPFEIILIEEYKSRQEARIREKHLKSGEGKEFLKMK